MRGQTAKVLRKAAQAAIEATGKPWFDGYVENEKLRNPESAMRALAGMKPEQVKAALAAGWFVTGPRMYTESCGKDLYKTIKQTYKSTPPFFNKSKKETVRMLINLN